MTTLDDILSPLPRVETALHGPAHPDEFRLKRDNGDRWYMDNLPGCDIAPATDDVWPSVSKIKKAADRDWTWTSLERAATYLHDRRGELDGLNAEEIHKRLLEVNKAGLGRAAGRGTSIHHVMEALAAGATHLPQVTAEAEKYIPACQAWLDKHQPEWLLSEVVVINRAVGYGGTLDAVVVLDGNTLVDWKSRKSAEKHGAYPEEGWQLAAYRHAEYMIVDQDGEAVRRRLPQIDGGLIVSIAPEGCRVYPVDLDEAWATFQSLRQFWQDKQRKVIGRAVRLNGNGHHKAAETPPDGPRPIGPTAQLVAYRAWIQGRLEALKANPAAVAVMTANWPAGVPGLRTEHPHTEAELEQIGQVLDGIETSYEMPFPTPDPRRPAYTPQPDPEPAPALIDEGGDCSSTDMLAVLKQVEALPSVVRMTLLNTWAKEALEAGVGFNIRLHPSQRRLAIYKACIALAHIEDTDVIHACVRHTLGDDTPVATLGALIGSLTIDQATRLGETAAHLTNGGLTLHYRDDGSAHLTPTSESEPA